ncbi:MAG: hypothetical protein GQ535_05435 [Rhodobacteraceae bacterium]|nr:hypothetical protein [Paracoccaceae bacterium]
MNKHTTDFDDIENAAADKRHLQEFDDLQNEMAGRETGRAPRVLSREERERIEKQRNGGQSAMSALEFLLLNDPDYAAFHQATMVQLAGIEDATERALENAVANAELADAALRDAIERSAVLADGTHVFEDAQGVVWTQNGEIVGEDIVAGIEWQGTETTREKFLQLSEAAGQSNDTVTGIRVYQMEVGEAREAMTDPDNPLSREEIEAKFESLTARMPDAVRDEMPVTDLELSADAKPEFGLTIPDIQF